MRELVRRALSAKYSAEIVERIIASIIFGDNRGLVTDLKTLIELLGRPKGKNGFDGTFYVHWPVLSDLTEYFWVSSDQMLVSGEPFSMRLSQDQNRLGGGFAENKLFDVVFHCPFNSGEDRIVRSLWAISPEWLVNEDFVEPANIQVAETAISAELFSTIVAAAKANRRPLLWYWATARLKLAVQILEALGLKRAIILCLLDGSIRCSNPRCDFDTAARESDALFQRWDTAWHVNMQYTELDVALRRSLYRDFDPHHLDEETSHLVSKANQFNQKIKALVDEINTLIRDRRHELPMPAEKQKKLATRTSL